MRDLAELVAERESVLASFLEHEKGRIALACHAVARAFARGGTLIPFGTGAAATDAAHVAVEFMHPVIVGKRALPAVAPTNDPTGGSTVLRLARPDDIALGLVHGTEDPAVTEFLELARGRGLLTVAMTGGGAPKADHTFLVPSDDPQIVQEVQETVYHVLWELVHVFFEHPGLLDDACITCGDVAVEAEVVALRNGTAVIEKGGLREEVAVDLVEGVAIGDVILCHAGVALSREKSSGLSAESGLSHRSARERERAPEAREQEASDFLYPFLGREEKDLDAVLADVAASTVQKGADVIALRRHIDLEQVKICADAIHDRLERGGRLIAFGNGGSATDAQDVVGDCLARGWPALALTNDAATITAVGNDVGYDKVFARQLIPLARADDVALAISTSGSSPNVLAGLEEAHRRNLLTCAITGYDGGRLLELPWLDHLFIAESDYIPRLQEAHATVYHLLLEAIGEKE